MIYKFYFQFNFLMNLYTLAGSATESHKIALCIFSLIPLILLCIHVIFQFRNKLQFYA